MEKKLKNDKKLSKRGKLYLANGIFFFLVLLSLISVTLMSHAPLSAERAFFYIVIQCIFTMFSLIVYFLSIIADAISVKNTYKNENNK